MTERTRRLVSMASAVLFVAALAATVAKPGNTAPPESKAKVKTAFAVKASLVQDMMTYQWDGDFAATGAIKDSGDALYNESWTYPTGWLGLYGEKGYISISIFGGSFTIESGTGVYENLQGGGTAKWRQSKRNPLRASVTLEGTIENPEP